MRELFFRWSLPLASAGVFLLPFKLTLAYIFIIPLTLLWILIHRKNICSEFPAWPLAVRSIFIFGIVALTTSLFGLNWHNSITHAGTFIFFPFIILVYRDIAKNHLEEIVTFLLYGLSLASVINSIQQGFPLFTDYFIGSVSESGQMVLVIFLALGYFLRIDQKSLKNLLQFNSLFIFLSSTLAVSMIGLGSLSRYTEIPFYGLFLLILLVIFLIFNSKKNQIFPLVLGLILGGFIANLKRGPWIGAAISTIIFLYHFRPKLVPIFLIIISIIVATVNPITERILSSINHFLISGGRLEIWKIGYELAVKYPLGIGYENSKILREYSVDIPSNLKHFHNNLLNVLVETGWIGLFLFCFWIYQLIKLFWTKDKNLFLFSISLAVIGWTIAGFVEYNFGDASVCNLLYIVIGIGLASFQQDLSFQSEIKS